MKKPLKITLVIVLVLALSAGATLAIIYFCRPKGQSRSEIDVTLADNTYIEDNTKNIADCSPTESLFILASNLKKLNSYYACISGEVDAGITKQTVSGEKYKLGGASLYVSRSTSSFKKTANQIFIEADVVLVRNGDLNTNVYEDTADKYALSDYLEEYGTDFRELSNYELNGTTITKAELISAVGGKYSYRYEIDVATGVKGYRVNMYKMGGLSELPTFKKSTLEVTMTENFMPVSVTQIDEYSVVYFGIIPIDCTSTLVEEFEKINDDTVEIPEAEFFKSKLDG